MNFRYSIRMSPIGECDSVIFRCPPVKMASPTLDVRAGGPYPFRPKAKGERVKGASLEESS